MICLKECKGWVENLGYKIKTAEYLIVLFKNRHIVCLFHRYISLIQRKFSHLDFFLHFEQFQFIKKS